MFIQEAELFQGVSQATMAEISEIMVEESSDRGSLIFSEGDHADSFYVLLRGQVRLATGRISGIEYLLNRSGEAFGWSSLVDRPTYTARAECITPTTYIRIDKKIWLINRSCPPLCCTRFLYINPHHYF